MLQYYFDILHKDDADVFHGLQIDSLGDEYKQHQNQYPVKSGLTTREVGGWYFTNLSTTKICLSTSD